ncbi:hypothetical protein MMC14_008063 [Varicellaria rhodocarpa]|nr:hypothetical protein [Varicellaria rhodocarpa]
MKLSKGANASQKHLQSRITYLLQAATYLTTAQHSHYSQSLATSSPKLGVVNTGPRDAKSSTFSSLKVGGAHTTVASSTDDRTEDPLDFNTFQNIDATKQPRKDGGCENSLTRSVMACRLSSHLRTVAMKGQVHLSPTMKQSICKRCQSILIPGLTMSSHIENRSKNGQKPWADIQVKTCYSCGTTQRSPTRMRRQLSKKDRAKKSLMVKTEKVNGE